MIERSNSVVEQSCDVNPTSRPRLPRQLLKSGWLANYPREIAIEDKVKHHARGQQYSLPAARRFATSQVIVAKRVL